MDPKTTPKAPKNSGGGHFAQKNPEIFPAADRMKLGYAFYCSLRTQFPGHFKTFNSLLTLQDYLFSCHSLSVEELLNCTGVKWLTS